MMILNFKQKTSSQFPTAKIRNRNFPISAPDFGRYEQKLTRNRNLPVSAVMSKNNIKNILLPYFTAETRRFRLRNFPVK